MRVRDAFERSQKKLYRSLQKELRHLDQAKDRYLLAYERAYKRSLRKPIQTSKRQSLLSAAANARVTLVGDFHPFRQSQKGFLRLVKESRAISKKPTVIAVECVLLKFQSSLDNFLAGRITANELREEIEFEDHWPFAWEAYFEIFAYAKAEKIPLLALNIAPTPGSRFALQERDKAAAIRLCSFAEEFPIAQFFGLYGELHLADRHLPARIRESLKGRTLVIHQNEPYLYWAAPRDSTGERPEVLRLSSNEFCVLNSVPWIKLRSYLDWAEGSTDDEWEEGTDVTGAVIHFSSMLAELLKISPAGNDLAEIRGEAEMREPLPRSASAFDKLLFKHSKNFHRVSALTSSRILLAPSLSTNALTEAGALYLWSKSNHGRTPPEYGPRLLVQFMAGFLGSKLLNPKRKCNEEEDMRSYLQKGLRDTKTQVFGRALGILSPILHGKSRASRRLSPMRELEAIRLAGYVLGNRLFFHWGRRESAARLVPEVFTSAVSTEAWAYHLLSRVKHELKKASKLPPSKHARF